MMKNAQSFVIVAWYGTALLVLATKSHLKAEYGCAAHAMRNVMSNS